MFWRNERLRQCQSLSDFAVARHGFGIGRDFPAVSFKIREIYADCSFSVSPGDQGICQFLRKQNICHYPAAAIVVDGYLHIHIHPAAREEKRCSRADEPKEKAA